MEGIGGRQMTLSKLFEKYGHVEVFAVEDGILKEHYGNNWNNLSHEEIERTLQEIGEFLPRYRAELDKSYRQIIPYCVIMCEDKIFTTQRLKGDERLVGKYSIGIGGHIEKVDAQGDAIIRDALHRELDEEVDIGSNIEDIEILGHICIDDSSVDSVHYGLAYRITLDGFDVKVKETDTLEGSWQTRDELMALKDNLEDWSVYCLENFI